MQHDAFFFIGIFVFIFLIWVATGGPTHPISFAGPLLSAPAPLGTGTYISLPTAGVGIRSGDVELLNPLTGIDGSGNGISLTPPASELGGVAFGPASPYRNEVTLSHYVSGAGSSNPDDEYITISLSSSATSSVDISGWTIESAASNNAAIIPEGTEVPMSGTIEAVQPIVLNPGDKALVISGVSPIGASFRENECIGYYANFQTFSPSLSDSCPSPTTEMQKYYPTYISDTVCESFIQKLSSCEVPTSFPTGASSACQNFIAEHLNYNGCVMEHQNDSDFAINEWRIYLGRNQALWRTQYEVVKLLDANGKTVDEFTY